MQLNDAPFLAGRSTDDFVNGHQEIAAVEVSGYARLDGEQFGSYAITSVYGKSNAVTKLFRDAVISHNNGAATVYYMDTKKARALLQRAGVQFSGALPRDGFIDKITVPGSPVKHITKLFCNTSRQ